MNALKATIPQVLRNRFTLAWARLLYGLERRLGTRRHVLRLAPRDLRVVDPTLAQAMQEGSIALAGDHVEIGGENPFSLLCVSARWRDALWAFDWLTHLNALPLHQAQPLAKKLFMQWHQAANQYSGSPSNIVCAQRVVNMISHAPYAIGGAELSYFRYYCAEVRFQARLLARTWRCEISPYGRIMCLMAVSYASVALTTHRERQLRAANLLLETLKVREYWHHELTPEQQYHCLRLLVPLQLTWQSLGLEISEPADAWLQITLGELAMLRHGDGTQTVMTGTPPVAANELAALLAHWRGGPVVNGCMKDGRVQSLHNHEWHIFACPEPFHQSLSMSFELSHRFTRIFAHSFERRSIREIDEFPVAQCIWVNGQRIYPQNSGKAVIHNEAARRTDSLVLHGGTVDRKHDWQRILVLDPARHSLFGREHYARGRSKDLPKGAYILTFTLRGKCESLIESDTSVVITHSSGDWRFSCDKGNIVLGQETAAWLDSLTGEQKHQWSQNVKERLSLCHFAICGLLACDEELTWILRRLG